MFYLKYPDVGAAVFVLICVMESITISVCFVLATSTVAFFDVDATEFHSQLGDLRNDHRLVC